MCYELLTDVCSGGGVGNPTETWYTCVAGNQAATLVIFSSARQFLFSFFFAGVGSTFGYDNFGFLTGLANGTLIECVLLLRMCSGTLQSSALALSCTHTEKRKSWKWGGR